MTEPTRCPSCHREIPPDAPAGLCPACLLQTAACPSDLSGPNDPANTPTSASPVGAPADAPSVESLAGRFPQLEILELLGKGGMGAVYKARQHGLDRLVAVKLLPAGLGADPAFAERFAREARALGRLSHPNIVAIHEFGESQGQFYFVMEFVDGVNLRQAIQAGRLAPRDALAIIPQVCDALQYAHDEGIIHRDIKPENILVSGRGKVKIADFGLAKLLGQDAGDINLTHTSQVMGTLRYMAPEQLEGSRNVDHRADIFSLGVVFYELLTGELPIGRFAPPSRKVNVDARLDEVVLRALEKEPMQRYQQAADLKHDTESAVAASPAPAPAEPSDTSVGDFDDALPTALSVAVSLVMGLLIITAGLIMVPTAFFMAQAGSERFWGWIGGAIGCIAGGCGTMAGAWNSYRQFRGEKNWITCDRWTGLDLGLAIYGAVGLVLLTVPPLLLLTGVTPSVDTTVERATFHGSWTLGGVMLLQSTIFLGIRRLYVKGEPVAPADRLKQAGRRLTTVGILMLVCFVPVLAIVAHSDNTVRHGGPPGHTAPEHFRASLVMLWSSFALLWSLLAGGVVTRAGLNLQRDEDGFSTVGPILAAIPLSPAVLLGLPVALSVRRTLNRPDVQAYIAEKSRQREDDDRKAARGETVAHALGVIVRMALGSIGGLARVALLLTAITGLFHLNSYWFTTTITADVAVRGSSFQGQLARIERQGFETPIGQLCGLAFLLIIGLTVIPGRAPARDVGAILLALAAAGLAGNALINPPLPETSPELRSASRKLHQIFPNEEIFNPRLANDRLHLESLGRLYQIDFRHELGNGPKATLALACAAALLAWIRFLGNR